jgi:ligand-binding sensor domain-containing protein
MYRFYLCALLLYIYCSNSPQWQTINTKNTSINTNLIRQIIINNEILSWVGTFGGGLYKIDGRKYKKVGHPFTGKYIFSLKKDSTGGLWVGTAKYGAYYYNKGTWTHLDRKSGLAGNNVWHILRMSIKQGLPDRQVTVAEEDTRGNVWIGTARGGLCCFSSDSIHLFYNKKNGLSGNYIRALICDTTIKWVGSWDGGLDLFTGEKWEHINEIKKPVVFLGYDKYKNLWIGTWGYGIYYQYPEGWKRITHKNSALPNNYVIDIKFAQNGKIYFATSGGVAIYTQ